METQLVSGINNSLNNINLRIFLFLLTFVYAGYTLQPVPVWLNNLLTNSIIFKLIVLITIGAIYLHPLDVNKMRSVVILSIILLFVFFIFRLLDIVSV